MAAPPYVPKRAVRTLRTYTSPPRRPGSWRADRPGDLAARQPTGPGLGRPGPDQGYLLTLTDRFRGQLHLHPGEDEDDALAGATAVGLKRAAILGRAPVIHDLTVGLTVWGFLDPAADKALVDLRHPMFAGCSHPHHEAQRRAIAAAVPSSVLAQPHETIYEQYRDGWSQVIRVD
jgi:hypothetical protein